MATIIKDHSSCRVMEVSSASNHNDNAHTCHGQPHQTRNQV